MDDIDRFPVVPAAPPPYYDGGKTKKERHNHVCSWEQHRWRGQSRRIRIRIRILLAVVVAVVLVAGTTTIVVLTILNAWLLPPPELYYAETFQLQDIQLPPQCVEVTQKLQASQRIRDRPSQEEEEEDVRLAACHRKWCQSRGHCDPCTGIGDRTRALMNKVQQAVEEDYVKIQLDYPLNDCDMAVLESVVYIDPSGWFGEVFHYRSYHDPDEHPVLHLRQQQQQQQQQQYHQQQQRVHVMGFFNKPINNVHDYNACYFHALFQPGRRLQAEIEHHEQAIGPGPSIGLHYRTGDVLAFGMSDHDNRVAIGSVLDGWQKMLQCGQVLASRLFPQTPLDQVTFYVATDNLQLKQQQLLQAQQGNNNTTTKNGSKIYVTDITPNHSTKGSDRDAWLELYLLSQRQGLVANVNHAKKYDPDGGAKYPISKFAVLAAKVGFFEPHELMPCDLDDENTRDGYGKKQQQQQHKKWDDNRTIAWY